MANQNKNRIGCAIYAKTDDPTYQVFDADLFEGLVEGGPEEFTPMALVLLKKGRVELQLCGHEYRLVTDTGAYLPHQLIVGIAGDEVRMISMAGLTGLDHFLGRTPPPLADEISTELALRRE